MRPNLKNGKLLAFISMEEDLKRLQQLQHETQKIEEQLADLTRIARYSMMSEYDRWHDQASHMLRQFKKEEVLIKERIDKESSGQELFQRAYALLLNLELEVDLEADEVLLMDQLDLYFERRPRKQLCG